MNILLTGANGQLGRHFQLLAPKSSHTWFFTDVEELDITDRDSVATFVKDNNIRLIINFSTDYVFGGTLYNTPCTEDMVPNPTGAYGRTKLAGERAAERCHHLIFRTSWLYSEFGKNFLLTMLSLTNEKQELRVVFDQVGTPTYAGDLAKAIFTIVESGEYQQHDGIYNFANEGVCSWYDFTKEIARQSGHTACRILPCHSNEYPSSVKRPAYSVLDKTKFKTTFLQEIPYWTEALERCLFNIQK